MVKQCETVGLLFLLQPYRINGLSGKLAISAILLQGTCKVRPYIKNAAWRK